MAPQKTANTHLAEELLEGMRHDYVEGKKNVHTLVCQEPHVVRQAMYRRMTDDEKRHIVIKTEDHMLIVSHKHEPKNVTIVNLLKEAMVHVDDEGLYERIFKAVHGG
jgi:hypothetical protein